MSPPPDEEEGRDPRPSSSRSVSTGEVTEKGERRRRTTRKRKKRPPPEPEETAARSRVGWALLALGAIVAGAAIAIFVVYPSSSGPNTGRDVELTFDIDEPLPSVVDKLSAAGLVASPRVFSIYARLVRYRPQPGAHFLTDDASPAELVRRTERSLFAQHAKVTIPEGFNRFDIAARLQKEKVTSATSFNAAATDPELLRELGIEGDSAEGYLFPATYEIPRDSDPKEVVRRLKTEFERRFTQLEQNHRLGLAQIEASLGWGRKEIVTLASMIEKEAVMNDERPIIASVFLNRLRDPAFKRKVLQCDPTAGYGCLVLGDRAPACAGYAGKITHAINVDPANTYSTYVHEGLPPGPIANPGARSLEAALAPASTKYLYFVARGEGRHAFSESLDEHNTAVRDLRDRSTQTQKTP